jgi:hypothetical protein
MEILLDRGSVSMGDDADDHRTVVSVQDDATVEQVLRAIDLLGFHHVNAGGLTTWTVRAGRRGPMLAAICLHYVAYVVQPDTPIRDLLDSDHATLMFGYEHNRDADRVRDEYLPPGVVGVGQVLRRTRW